MRRYYFVVTDHLDILNRRKESAEGTIPRHFFIALADYFNADVYEPYSESSAKIRKKMVHRCLNTSEYLIPLAEKIATLCQDEDVVFCIGEEIALPIAYNLRNLGKSTKIASLGHNLYRPRKYVANYIWKCLDRIDLFFVYNTDATNRSAKNTMYYDQTDDKFFTPFNESGDELDVTDKPIIASIGLEKRDNVILAEATKNLNVDVRITAFSRDTKINSKAMPKILPSNMTAEYYSWVDLLKLYQSARIVVVPVVPNTYAAGITSILEAAAVGKPIIATGNGSLMDAVADHKIADWVPPEDAQALEASIINLLNSPENCARLGQRAKSIQAKHHDFAGRIEEVATKLRAL